MNADMKKASIEITIDHVQKYFKKFGKSFKIYYFESIDKYFTTDTSGNEVILGSNYLDCIRTGNKLIGKGLL